MTNLTVPDLSDATMQALRARAEATGRTVEREAAQLLSQAATEPMDRAELLAWTRRIRAMTPEHAKQTDSTGIIREQREGGVRDDF
ncbi:MAG: hypothetical protein U5L06_16530 [Rhodovibrio sp.]|nr:hypothetical protein [Rhodovibrio sp.]